MPLNDPGRQDRKTSGNMRMGSESGDALVGQQTRGLGRGAALLALLLLVPVATLGETSALQWWPGAVGITLYVLGKLWLLALPAFWLVGVERQRWSWSKPRQGGFGVAVVLGLLMAGAIVGGYLLVRRAGLIDVGRIRALAGKNHLDSLAVYVSFVLVVSTLNSLMEEYVWRWFVFRKCETLLGSHGGVLAAALFFTLHHTCALAAYFNWRVTLLGSMGVLVGAVIWSAMYARYRSIWPGYVCHILADAGIFVVGYRLIFGGR